MNDAPPAPRATEPLAAAAPPRPSLSELFIAYALISLYGFGGVLAWSRRMMVEERRWLTPEQFNEAYALCSFLPGPNIVNFSVIFGSRVRAPLGVTAAAAGLIMSTVAKMALPLFRNRAVGGPVIALATFGAIGIAQWPLPIVLAVVLPISLALAWVRP